MFEYISLCLSVIFRKGPFLLLAIKQKTPRTCTVDVLGPQLWIHYVKVRDISKMNAEFSTRNVYICSL